MNKKLRLVLATATVVAVSAPLRAEGELTGVTTAIAGMATIMAAGVGAIVTAGVGIRVVPMGIRFLGKVWKAIAG